MFRARAKHEPSAASVTPTPLHVNLTHPWLLPLHPQVFVRPRLLPMRRTAQILLALLIEPIRSLCRPGLVPENLNPAEDPMPMNNLQAALEHEMQDLLHAEHQILNALPKMAEKASEPGLRQALEDHLDQTREHVKRLERALRAIGSEVATEKCEGIQGILSEGESLMSEDVDPDVLNAVLIASAQKVEHYEIASYGTACAWAEMLGHQEVLELLEQTLKEEAEADERLTRLAEERINRSAHKA